MALTGTHSVGIPIVLLHECEALVITVELTNGEVCRGRLTKAEDCFNLHMNDCVMTTPDAAKDRTIEKLFIRGDRVKMIICPPVLKTYRFSIDYNSSEIRKVAGCAAWLGRGKSSRSSGRGRGGELEVDEPIECTTLSSFS